MKGIDIAEVGDGLCMSVEFPEDKFLQVDCGSQQGGRKAIIEWKPYRARHTKTFLLSHFHTDHYNGLLVPAPSGLSNMSWNLDEVLFPGLPRFDDCQRFLVALHSVAIRTSKTVFGNATGHMTWDFLEAMFRLTGRGFSYRALSSGMPFSVGNDHFEVLWPPESIDRQTRKSVENALAAFEWALAHDDILKELHERLEASEYWRPYIDENAAGEKSKPNERVTLSLSNAADAKLIGALNSRKHIPRETKSANEKLRSVANRLSLAFRNRNKLLFLGDLENEDIGQVLGKMASTVCGCFKDAPISLFDVLVTPHHGTHWHAELHNILCIYAATSNGPKRIQDRRKEFRDISLVNHCTFCDGPIAIEFDSSETVRCNMAPDDYLKVFSKFKCFCSSRGEEVFPRMDDVKSNSGFRSKIASIATAYQVYRDAKSRKVLSRSEKI